MRHNFDNRLNIAFFFVFLCVFLNSGCDRRPARRVYTEVHVSPPVEAQTPAADPLAQPADQKTNDPHVFLRDMPMDETHAAVRRQMSGGEKDTAAPAAAGDMQMPPGAASDQMQEMLNASAAKPPLSWETPEGWQELPGGGMRLATFKSSDADDPVECALISLAGAAGGLESNVARWMGQVKLEVLSGEKMQKFLVSQEKIQTRDGLSATIIDLAQLQADKYPQAPSMIGTIIELDSMTVFVKMTGPREAVLKNKEKFESLCRSFKLNQDGNAP